MFKVNTKRLYIGEAYKLDKKANSKIQVQNTIFESNYRSLGRVLVKKTLFGNYKNFITDIKYKFYKEDKEYPFVIIEKQLTKFSESLPNRYNNIKFGKKEIIQVYNAEFGKRLIKNNERRVR